MKKKDWDDNFDKQQLTEWDGEDEYVVDVDEWPRDADGGQTARRDDVGVDETTFQIVAKHWRQHVRHELGQTEQCQRNGTLLQRYSFTLHVITLQAARIAIIASH